MIRSFTSRNSSWFPTTRSPRPWPTSTGRSGNDESSQVTRVSAGPAGIGKTIMGLHFIFLGRAERRGRRDRDSPRMPASWGGGPEASAGRRARGVELMYRSPVDLYGDQWVYELLETIERTGARRVLIDSLTNVEYATGDAIRFSEYVYSLTLRCSRARVSLLMDDG